MSCYWSGLSAAHAAHGFYIRCSQLQSSTDSGQGMNPISRLAQIQQAKKEKEPEYMLLTERGLPRRREFVMQVSRCGWWAALPLPAPSQRDRVQGPDAFLRRPGLVPWPSGPCSPPSDVSNIENMLFEVICLKTCPCVHTARAAESAGGRSGRAPGQQC